MLLYIYQLLSVSKSFQIITKEDYRTVMNFINYTRLDMDYCAFEMDAFFSFSIVNSTFISNKRYLNSPGAIKSSGIGPTIISNTNLTHNTGMSKGVAIYLDVDTVIISYCFFYKNYMQ